MPLSLTKMCGAGNDFLITDENRIGSKRNFHTHLKKKIRKWCNRKFGLGADGFCFLHFDKKNQLKWLFFNSDGSSAKMCGNAACCIVHYAYKYKLTRKGKPFPFQIQKDTLKGELLPSGEAQINCRHPEWIEKNIKIKGSRVSLVHSGVNHLLIKKTNIKNLEKLASTAKNLRKKFPDFNITFYNKINSRNISCATYEKGVEDFTLACGTGALAVSFLHYRPIKNFSVQMPGGVLKVLFKDNQVFLTSPVDFIAEMIPFE